MESQVREHQVQLRRRLESIKRIHTASDTLENRLAELEHVREGITEQYKEMESLIKEVDTVLDAAHHERFELSA
jgi:chaperonin cofactor prefoldin